MSNNFSHFPNLQSLTIINLPVYRFNENLVLNQLQHLYLVNTTLSQFPKFLYGSESLKSLVVNQAPLQTLPNEIGTLTQLESLEISVAPITDLPTEVFKLGNLTALTFTDTEITEIPDEVLNLHKLEALTVSSTSGSVLYSPNLCCMPNLKTFTHNMPASSKAICFSNSPQWEEDGSIYKRK